MCSNALASEDRACSPTEQAQWQRRRRLRCTCPTTEERGIHPQDDSFLSKPRWDVATLDPRRETAAVAALPLAGHLSTPGLQAGRRAARAVAARATQFDADDKRRDFDYYEPLTTHDSSLSRCIFGIVASEVGYHDKAYGYFVDGVRADLDDHHHNTRHGVHTASMAGAWLGVVAGFAGLRMLRGDPAFAPQLPAGWSRCTFKLRLLGAQLEVSMARDATHYRLVEGDRVALRHRGNPVVLTAEAPLASFATASADIELPLEALT